MPANIDEQEVGAGEGNRTLVVSLGSFCSTIELHPRWGGFVRFCGQRQEVSMLGALAEYLFSLWTALPCQS